MKQDNMKNNTYFTVNILNIAFPLIIGMLIYCLASPDVIFVKYIDSFFGFSIDAREILTGDAVRFIRNYLPDMMWGYSLVFALFYSMGGTRDSLGLLLFITVLFSVIMESLQLLPVITGTFDLYDMVVEIIAEFAAIFIIKRRGQFLPNVEKRNREVISE